MKHQKQSQGRRIIAALKRKALTYGEMQRLGISTSPQKRVMECLRWPETVRRDRRADGLVTWRVVSDTNGVR
jgi:hypothetical protein